jgi:hypothetical protein
MDGVGAMPHDASETAPDEDTEFSSEPLHFVIGQDGSGYWVVVEAHGRSGGIFCSKDAALRFAKSETADRLADCAVVDERLEFGVRRR